MSILNKLKSVRQKRAARVLTVKSVNNLTQNMLRVTLTGEDLKGFPKDAEGGYVKLVFPQTGGTSGETKDVMRTYTIAEQRAEINEIDIDFMLHNNADGSLHGIAAPWAQNAKVGDQISIFGPGPVTLISKDADWFLLTADMTALPALTVSLKTLPQSARGVAFIEILSEADKQDLPKPTNFEIVWVINPEAGSAAAPLHKAITEYDWLPGKAAAWVACEFGTMRKIRDYLKVDKQLDKSQLYISSYWKQGNTEEQHKVAKQADAAA